MNAREMFKQLGYEFEKEYTSDGVNDTYRYDKCSGPTDSVIFVLDREQIVTNQTFHTISLDELQAIIQQCIELGWLEEETCTNESEYDSRDVFKCSNCGFISVHQTGLKSDEDNRVEFFYGYRPKYCPNCGSKIID